MERSPTGQASPDGEVLKRTWFNRAGSIFGPCGKLLYLDGKVVAWAQYAPASCFPHAQAYHTFPSQDAYLITCLAVAPSHRNKGYGEMLLKSVIDDLRLRGVKAVETFARRGSPDNPSGPVEFYLKKGFRITADDGKFPLLRFELRQPTVEYASIVNLSRL